MSFPGDLPSGLLHVTFLNWRDTTHPEGGGSEVYLERIASGLAAHGHRVTIMCADHGCAPRDEMRDGVRYLRDGGRLDVYPRAAWNLRRGAAGRTDVVVDVQNGIPFASTVARRTPTVVLVHHVHREQWPVVFPPHMARVGWWIESRVAPRIYRKSQYIAVSHRTRDELVGLGVDADRITVVHNGTEPAPSSTVAPAVEPRIVVLGRLVPHKQVEHVIDAVPQLRVRWPRVGVDIVGDGWWRDELVSRADEIGVSSSVTFHGHVAEAEKDRLLRRAWVLALPSIKEGWGLVIMEAAARGVPSVAYADAGGVSESIRHGATGLLAHDREDFVACLTRLIDDRVTRDAYGQAAAAHAADYTWDVSIKSFETVLTDAARARKRADQLLEP